MVKYNEQQSYTTNSHPLFYAFLHCFPLNLVSWLYILHSQLVIGHLLMPDCLNKTTNLEYLIRNHIKLAAVILAEKIPHGSVFLRQAHAQVSNLKNEEYQRMTPKTLGILIPLFLGHNFLLSCNLGGEKTLGCRCQARKTSCTQS